MLRGRKLIYYYIILETKLLFHMTQSTKFPGEFESGQKRVPR